MPSNNLHWDAGSDNIALKSDNTHITHHHHKYCQPLLQTKWSFRPTFQSGELEWAPPFMKNWNIEDIYINPNIEPWDPHNNQYLWVYLWNEIIILINLNYPGGCHCSAWLSSTLKSLTLRWLVVVMVTTPDTILMAIWLSSDYYRFQTFYKTKFKQTLKLPRKKLYGKYNVLKYVKLE